PALEAPGREQDARGAAA
ncbi:sensor histidine kinase, partial [Burkholderia mallei FMH]